MPPHARQALGYYNPNYTIPYQQRPQRTKWPKKPWDIILVLTLFVLLLACLVLLFLQLCYIVESSRFKYSVQSPYDWTDYLRSLLDLFEKAAPGSTSGMASFIPEKWMLEQTDFYLHLLGFCRKSKGESPNCLKRYHGDTFQNDIVYGLAFLIARSRVHDKWELEIVATEWTNRLTGAASLAKAAIEGKAPRRIDKAAIAIIENYWDLSSRPVFVSVLLCLPFPLYFTLVIGAFAVGTRALIVFGLLAACFQLLLVIELLCRHNSTVGVLDKSKGGALTMAIVAWVLETLLAAFAVVTLRREPKERS